MQRRAHGAAARLRGTVAAAVAWGLSACASAPPSTPPVTLASAASAVPDDGGACSREGEATCSADRQAKLSCARGRWEVLSACRGPRACTGAGEAIACDDDLGDVGDACVTEAGSPVNFACSVDRRAMTECKANRFELALECLGPKGCYVADDLVHCDQSIARDGIACRLAGKAACSDDGRSLLVCGADNRFVRRQGCERACAPIPAPARCDAP